jgi:DNA-binding GntR family transcriptional regulator
LHGRASRALVVTGPDRDGGLPDDVSLVAGDGDAPRGLVDRVYHSLRDSILAGELEAGTTMVESHLAEALGVSRTPVRQALGLLAKEGLVDQGRGRRLTVRVLGADDRAEIVQLRLVLEEMSVVRAAEVMGHEDTDVLRILVRRMRRAAEAGDQTTFTELNEAFHLGIAAGAGLPVVHRFLVQLGALIRLTQVGMTLTPEELSRQAEEHDAILDAVEARDLDAARSALALHLGTRSVATRAAQ